MLLHEFAIIPSYSALQVNSAFSSDCFNGRETQMPKKVLHMSRRECYAVIVSFVMVLGGWIKKELPAL